MSEIVEYFVRAGAGRMTAAQWEAKCRATWSGTPERVKNTIRYNFARYLSFLVNYVKKNKLSGQVLGKYTGRYDLIGGNPRWRHAPGALRNTFRAATEERSASVRATFFETIYGRAWEHGFSRKAYTVSPKHLTRRGSFGWLVFFGRGKWNFSQRVEIPAQTFPAKPHVRPSIAETQLQFSSMVLRPLINLMAGNLEGVRRVGGDK